MKIDVLCGAEKNSTTGVTMNTVWGLDGRIGAGGSELAILTLCELWQNAGHSVRLYNDPKDVGVSEFEQLPVASYVPKESRDILIIFRVPNPVITVASTAKRKVFLSFDQFTSQPFHGFLNLVDDVVGISNYHKQYFVDNYNFHDMQVIDLPVRVDDFTGIECGKILNRIIFTSVPGRGLMNLHAIWPELKREVSNLSLVITSDYRLWGVSDPRNSQYFMHFLGAEDVQFIGAVNRQRYLEEICKADLLVYPHKEVNAELFCLSVVEAQFAGAYPITSSYGALGTTNGSGVVIPGDPETIQWRKKCINSVVSVLSDRDALQNKQNVSTKYAYDRFRPEIIMNEWEKVFNGK